MTAFGRPEYVRHTGIRGEVGKLRAFLRRDSLTQWSDRLAFMSELAGVAVGVAMFALVGRMIDPMALPVYAGVRPTYMEFAAVGIVLGAFIQVGIARVARAIETEQDRGTFESLLATPTATPTIFLGSVMYDLLYVPIRTAVFLAAIVLAFGLDYRLGGIAPAALFLLAFLPFVWGLGMVNAAITMTFRRGAGIFSVFVTLFTVGAGIYFPLKVIPGPAEEIAPFNPIWVAATGMRESLLFGDWSAVDAKIAALPLLSLVALALGMVAIRAAMRRERERGSLALY